MSHNFNQRIDNELSALQASNQYKQLRYVTTAMGPVVSIEGYGNVIMLCSNDYLALVNHPAVVQAGVGALNRYGAGTASVRFITGTFDIHRTLESSLAELSGTQSALTYSSAWAANEALFPTLVGPNDVVLSDALNHASLIDSIRQSRPAKREVYNHSDLNHLEDLLKQNVTVDARWVVTDGVFSMEGDVANLAAISKLCRQYDAILVVDDSHGVGVLGASGKGTAEHFGVMDEIDITTGTLGKALGGAAGGYIAASQRVVDYLIQKSRPSLFSNALPATVAASANEAIAVISREPSRLERLRQNAELLRNGLQALGYECHESPSAIIPIIVGETADAISKSQRLLELGVMVIGFGYPVVPKGQARLRIQASAGLTSENIESALDAFAKL